MERIFSSPLRVYVIIASFALSGIIAALYLPVSLFPNSSKPTVFVGIGYGSDTAEEFFNTHGRNLEFELSSISSGKITVDSVQAKYTPQGSEFLVEFNWGVEPSAALKEVRGVVNAFSARLSQEARDTVSVWLRNRNSGFFAASFFSDKRSLEEVYDILSPLLTPKLSGIADAQNPALWNPEQKELRIELDAELMAAFEMSPKTIEASLREKFSARSGGNAVLGDKPIRIEMPKEARELSELGHLLIPTGLGRMVHLSEIAHIDFGPKTFDTTSIRTSGVPSLILFSTPKPGGNVKKMSEDIVAVIDEIKPKLPSDIQQKILVDPSEFIRSSIRHVFYEVAIAALLAVVILYLFIGSFRNIVTAAIEIPISMVLAFILMRLTGINLNLISLSGLALSAGMNVDASVVVMENIFRHFNEKHTSHHTSASARLKILCDAVREVRAPVIASTLTSLIVFLPLLFTSSLSYAILADLAFAVMFSHAFSAIIALILVPTIRLQLLAREKRQVVSSTLCQDDLPGKAIHHGGLPSDTTHHAEGSSAQATAHHSGSSAQATVHHSGSPIETWLNALESLYIRILRGFLVSPRRRHVGYSGLCVLLVLLLSFVLPRLPRELIGSPDSDWLILIVRDNAGNSLVKQMENKAEEVERDALTQFSNAIDYTFTQVQSPNDAYIMLRLKNKKEMPGLLKKMEAKFTSTPLVTFHVNKWNPSELPLPDPPDLRVTLQGGDHENRAMWAKELSEELQAKKVFTNVGWEPEGDNAQNLLIRPRAQQFSILNSRGIRLAPTDLSDLARLATTGKMIGRFPYKERLTDIVLGFGNRQLPSVDNIESLAIGAGGKILPLKALADFSLIESPPTIFRENQRELFLVKARELSENAKLVPQKQKEAKAVIEKWVSERPKDSKSPIVSIEEPNPELVSAIKQLSLALLLSLVLIFLTLLLQFESWIESLIIMVAIPLGFIGVLSSLFIFGSTLSLNSVLGVILLNGIAVANSIILVDFMRRLRTLGKTPIEAALEAARKRLRPILITSLTTILGMLPIALGFGEGGKILQPLGIAVSGGLWVSMVLTLFVVPSLYVSYATSRANMPSRIWAFVIGLFRLPGISLKRRTLQEVSYQSRIWIGIVVILGVLLFASMSQAIEPITSGVTTSRQGPNDNTIDFFDAVNEIVDKHTLVATQKANIDSANAKALPARLGLLPTVRLEAAYSGANNPSGSQQSRGVGANIDLNIFRFGGDLYLLRAANAEVDAESLLLEGAILKAEADAVEALVAFIETHMEYQTLKAIVALREELKATAQKRYDKGLLPLQEVGKLEVDLNNAKAKLHDGEIALNQRSAYLDTLLSHHGIKTQWVRKDHVMANSHDLVNSSETVWHRHPDLMALEKKQQAAGERTSELKAKILPSIDASFGYGYYRKDGGAYGGGATTGPQWQGALTLSIPLFDKLTNYSSYKNSVTVSTKIAIELEGLRKKAKSDWEQTKESLAVALQTVQIRQQTLELSKKIYQDNLKRFREGRTNANELSLDETRVFDAELFAIRGWGQLYRYFAKLSHAAGKRMMVK